MPERLLALAIGVIILLVLIILFFVLLRASGIAH